MKYLIASDIHGDFESAEIILEKFNKFGCEKIILLGDILYHGPRNDLPKNYNPKKVIEILNSVSDKIIAVQGNCDAEVDQMVLNFELKAFDEIEENGQKFYLTHGHKVSADCPLEDKDNYIVLHGHTHIIKKTVVGSNTYINIGSITLPKENTDRCYAILNQDSVSVFNLEDSLVLEHKF